MSDGLKLWIAGAVLTGLLLLFPKLSLVTLVLPGLLLPSLFLYATLWVALRWVMLRATALAGFASPSRSVLWTAAVLATATAAAVATIVPARVDAPFAALSRSLRADDRSVTSPIALPPVVGVVTSPEYAEVLPACGEVCRRLLYNKAVEKVVVTRVPRPNTEIPEKYRRTASYRLGACSDPDAVERKRVSSDVVFPNDSPGDMAFVRVRNRMAAGECLVAEDGNLEQPQLIISLQEIRSGESKFDHQWQLDLDTVQATRLEITLPGGEVLYRRTEVKSEPLITPLMIEAASGPLTTVTYAGWVRSRLIENELGPAGRDVLPAVLGAAVRKPDNPPGVSDAPPYKKGFGPKSRSRQ